MQLVRILFWALAVVLLWMRLSALRFWNLAAEEGCQAILGWDVHAPDQICKPEAEKTLRMAAEQLGMELLDTVEFRIV